MSEVRPQLDELLFRSVENVSVELVEVTDTVVRVEAQTCHWGGLSGLRVLVSANPRLLPAVSQ
ncbi:hypothetical protein ACIGW7_37795 [Streptomyces sp. NPDC053253]|uniref:hypothetical protein n=1 Tax=Streptomyces sp. NPDC053253 TaxID=3365699 RepID=UPI0037D98F4B